jgi:hypothetical protein
MNGKSETYRAGDRCDVPAGAVHSARMGPKGCRYLTDRRALTRTNLLRCLLASFFRHFFSSSLLYFLPSFYGPIQQFHHVHHVLSGVMHAHARAELQQATRVGSNNGLRACGGRVLHFFRK